MNRGGPLRACGKRYATEEAAWCSKRAQAEGAVVIPCALGCGGFHVAVPKVKAAPVRRPAARCTGPDALTRAAVLERDGCRCVCCGISVIGQFYSLQHRDARGMGGTRREHVNCPCSLITMLGSGTTGCHGRVESNIDPEDEAKGYALRHGQVARLVPVMVFESPGGSGLSQYATCDGQWSTAAPAGVAA